MSSVFYMDKQMIKKMGRMTLIRFHMRVISDFPQGGLFR